jgi:hypothetical protein
MTNLNDAALKGFTIAFYKKGKYKLGSRSKRVKYAKQNGWLKGKMILLYLEQYSYKMNLTYDSLIYFLKADKPSIYKRGRQHK